MKRPAWFMLLGLALCIGLIYGWQRLEKEKFQPMVITRCLKPAAYNNALRGKLVLVPDKEDNGKLLWEGGRYYGVFYGSMIYDLKSGNMTPLEEHAYAGNFSSSPNGNWLAYEKVFVENEQMTRLLSLLSYKGERREIALDENFVLSSYNYYKTLLYWLNENTLVFQEKREGDLPVTVMFDINTGEIQKLVPEEYDEIIPLENYWFWRAHHVVTYSPDMSRSLYLAETSVFLRTSTNLENIDRADLILYDNQHHRPLLRLRGLEGDDRPVYRWKNDSSGFFLAQNNLYDSPFHVSASRYSADLWLIGKDGEMKLIFSKSFWPGYPYDSLYIEGFSPSPDGRILEVRVGNWAGAILTDVDWLIVDSETGKFFDFCWAVSNHHPPIWSPNGQYIAFDPPENDMFGSSNRTMILDLKRKAIYEITDSYIPVGWLK